MAASDYIDTVQGYYIAYYGRWADPAGLTFWTNKLDAAGGDASEIIEEFGNSAEYLSTYAAFLDGDGNIIDQDGIINALFQNMFGRDAGGGVFYQDLLNGTNLSGDNPELRVSSLPAIAIDIYNGATGQDAVILANKLTVAKYATDEIISSGVDYDASDIAEARAILAEVGADAGDVGDGQDAVDEFIDPTLDNEAPTLSTQVFSNAENQTAGAVLGQVAASDNEGVTAYDIVSGNSAGYFAIDDSGFLTLTAAGAAAAANDFEIFPNTFNLGVTASDAAGNTSLITNMTLLVTDVDDQAPSLISATATGSTVVLAFDEALASGLLPVNAFAVADGGGASVAINSVAVSGSEVTLNLGAPLVGAATVSYAPPAVGNTLADAAGNDVAAFSGVPTIDEEEPTLTGDTFSYDENSAADTALGQVTASDNLSVTGYDIVSGNNNGFFAIDSTGVVTLTAAGAAAAANDFEALPNTFVLGVQASDDAGNFSAVANVELNVNDVDDQAPVLTGGVFNYAENSAAGDVLATVGATDDVGVVAFSFTYGNSLGYFAINSAGEITLTAAGAAAAANDFEAAPNGFTVGVQAQDAVGNTSTPVDVSLVVTDVDDEAPTLIGTTPLDDADEIPLDAELTLTFSEDVQAGAPTGLIILTNDADPLDVREILIGDATISGNEVSFTPASPLLPGADYTVSVQAGAIEDLSGNAFGGISGTTFNFTTVPPVDPPTLVAVPNPVDEFATVDLNFAGGLANELYSYVISGDVNADDIDGPAPLIGTFVTDANGDASFSLDITNDKTTEGEETMTVSIIGELFGFDVSTDVTINDTSEDNKAPVVDPLAAVDVLESDAPVTLQVSASDADGDTLTYELDDPSQADFISLDSVTGELVFDVQDYLDGSDDLTPLDDSRLSPVESETINVTINVTDGEATTPVTLTATVSGDPLTYTLTPTGETVNEGESLAFTVTASEAVAEDTDILFTLPAALNGDITASDVVATSFSTTMAAGTDSATFTLNAVLDDQVEFPENFTVQAAIDPNSYDTDGETLTAGGTILDVPSDTFVLTTGLDEVFGPDSDDTIKAPIVVEGGSVSSTWNLSDIVNGGDGTDTFNIFVGVGNPDGIIPTFSNTLQHSNVDEVEIINIYGQDFLGGGITVGIFNGSDAGIDASLFGSDAEQIWQINVANDISNVGPNTAVGFRDIVAEASFFGGSDGIVEVGFEGPTGTVVLDEFPSDLAFDFNDDGVASDDLTELNITGSVEEVGAPTDTIPDLCGFDSLDDRYPGPMGLGQLTYVDDDGSGLLGLETLNVSLTSHTQLNVFGGNLPSLRTINGSGSTGALVLIGDLSTAPSPLVLEEVSTGSGMDTLLVTGSAADLDPASGAFTIMTNDGDDYVAWGVEGFGYGSSDGDTLSIMTGADTDVIDILGDALFNPASDDILPMLDGGAGSDDTLCVNLSSITFTATEGLNALDFSSTQALEHLVLYAPPIGGVLDIGPDGDSLDLRDTDFVGLTLDTAVQISFPDGAGNREDFTLFTDADFNHVVINEPLTSTDPDSPGRLIIDGATSLTADINASVGDPADVGAPPGGVQIDFGTVEDLVLNFGPEAMAPLDFVSAIVGSASLATATVNFSDGGHSMIIPFLEADALTELTVNLAEDGTLQGPFGGSTASLTDWTITGGADSSFDIAVGPPTPLFETLDLSGFSGGSETFSGASGPTLADDADGGVVNLSGFSGATGPLTVDVGSGDLLVSLMPQPGSSTSVDATIFNFDGPDIGIVEIDEFAPLGGAANGDKIDLTALNVESSSELNFNETTWGTGDIDSGVVITSADGDFTGQIRLIGLDSSDVNAILGGSAIIYGSATV